MSREPQVAARSRGQETDVAFEFAIECVSSSSAAFPPPPLRGVMFIKVVARGIVTALRQVQSPLPLTPCMTNQPHHRRRVRVERNASLTDAYPWLSRNCALSPARGTSPVGWCLASTIHPERQAADGRPCSDNANSPLCARKHARLLTAWLFGLPPFKIMGACEPLEGDGIDCEDAAIWYSGEWRHYCRWPDDDWSTALLEHE